MAARPLLRRDVSRRRADGLAGFSRTYFLKGYFGTKALTPFFHLHGAMFSCWIILFVAQVALVRAGHTDLHRRTGFAAVILFPMMIVIGFMAAVDSARRGFTPPGGPPPLVFVVPSTQVACVTTRTAAHREPCRSASRRTRELRRRKRLCPRSSDRSRATPFIRSRSSSGLDRRSQTLSEMTNAKNAAKNIHPAGQRREPAGRTSASANTAIIPMICITS